MEAYKLSQLIQQKINELEKGRNVIKSRAEKKAETISTYDRELALAIIKLRNGIELEIEGQKIQNPPVTIIEKIAKGYCWEAKRDAEEADALYKSAITHIETVKAELNGLQSINRYLDQT